MKSAAFKFVIVLAAVLALGACRSAPIYNVASAVMATPADAALEDITAAIKRPGAGATQTGKALFERIHAIAPLAPVTSALAAVIDT